VVLLHPKRRTEAFAFEPPGRLLQSVNDPHAVREAIAFYSAASFVFHSGLYRDEEGVPSARLLASRREAH
jgi:hypothetical protein